MYQHKYLACGFPPSNIIAAHGEMSLDSEQLTSGASKHPEEKEKRKTVRNCFDSIVIRSLIAINIPLCSFSYQKLIQLLPFRRKHCEINSLPFSLAPV